MKSFNDNNLLDINSLELKSDIDDNVAILSNAIADAPVILVIGASASGKSQLAKRLSNDLSEALLLDGLNNQFIDKNIEHHSIYICDHVCHYSDDDFKTIDRLVRSRKKAVIMCHSTFDVPQYLYNKSVIFRLSENKGVQFMTVSGHKSFYLSEILKTYISKSKQP